MSTERLMATNEDAPVDEHTEPLGTFDGYTTTPIKRGTITAHEVVFDADGLPLGMESRVVGHWEIGNATLIE